MNPQPTPQTRGVFARFLDVVEWLGNLLPHPVTLFALICMAVLLASGLAGYFEVSVADPRPLGASGRSPDGVIRAISLLNPEGLRRISMKLVTNFTSFAPLGTVLVALLGVGVAERAGLLSAAIRALVLGAPPKPADRGRRLRGRRVEHGLGDGVCGPHPARGGRVSFRGT